MGAVSATHLAEHGDLGAAVVSMMDGYTVTLHDPRRDTDGEIAETAALEDVITREVFAEDPPTPVEQAIAIRRVIPHRILRWSFRARDPRGRLVGTAGTTVDPDSDDNPDAFWVHLAVHPDHRRRGLGSLLLSEIVGLARAERRTRLIGDTTEQVAGAADFARAMGAVAKMNEHLNHLPVAEVDRALLEQWVDNGPRRAPKHELIGFDGPVPDELLDAFVDLVLVMNTAPRDDLEIEDFTLTPERLREHEAQLAAAGAGAERWTLVARHAASGELAGYHDVVWDPSDPAVLWIGATGVKPAHRGHALGKWLKAAMTLRVLDERPRVADIRTGNADSNDAMLGINCAMGYRPLVAATTWELQVADAERILAARAGRNRWR